MVTTTRSTVRCTMYIVAGMRRLCTQIVNVLKKICTNHSFTRLQHRHINRFSSHHYHHEGQTQSPKFAFCKYFKRPFGFWLHVLTNASFSSICFAYYALSQSVYWFLMHTATTAVSTAFHCGRHHPVPVLPQQYRQSKQQLRSVLLFVIQPKVSQLVSSRYM